MSKKTKELIRWYIFLFFIGGSIGYIIDDFITENRRLRMECLSVNKFCVDNDNRFVCDKQVLPNGRTIIVVTEKK